MLTTQGKTGKIAGTLAVVAVSASLGMFVDWRASGINRYTEDWLVRARGPLPEPDDIAIVAIDELSIARYGQSRQVIARAIDTVAAAQPKAIAVDVVFSDPTTEEDDNALARSIGRAGNVVVAAQLTESPVRGRPPSWLLPLPEIARTAAAVGHVNIETELDGVVRQVSVRAADDAGQAFRAMAVEAIRIGDGTPEQRVTVTPQAVLLGWRRIPLDTSASPVPIAPTQGRANPAPVVPGGRMTIDAIGPAGSFGANTYSLADVAEGSVPPAKFHGKYVLIGATTGSLGDPIASPLHPTEARADQHGSPMPAVEVLANTVSTILRSRFYSDPSNWTAFFWVALIAAITVGLLEVAQGGHELLRQVAVLAGVAGAILLASYCAFTWLLMLPPLAPGLVSFASAGVLGLLLRSLDASARLDANIEELAYSGDLLAPAGSGIAGPYHHWVQGGPVTLARGWLPKGLEWKARTLSELNARLLERAKFVDLALRSVEDGLVIAAPDGRITFANRAAGAILGSTARGLVGQNLQRRLAGTLDDDTLSRLVSDGVRIDREIVVRSARPRHYTLRMAPVSAGDAADGPVLGIVASLSDVTRQYELQQTKNDVISLVSHEMRTPLTAIQGMTELLADYDVGPERRREMNLAINDEVKRLARMISEYLDITRLESGVTVLRPSPLHIETLIERVLVMLDPVAGQRGIRLVRNFAAGLPALVGDADLLSRAVENLVSNAIKYSPGGTDVTISASNDDSAFSIQVADQGYGIPEAGLARIFEKFYRVPRVQDADVPGTGLGLSLVREIAELHGGSVTVRSEVNAGSTFTVRLPLAETAPATEVTLDSGRLV
jgi:two-component system phosphate regulon sensor histidine kinase PhoR